MGFGTLFGFAMVGGLFIAAAAIGWFIVKVILAVILLPFRLLFWLVALPLLLVKAVVLSIVGVLAALLFAIGLVAAALGLVALIVPLLPILLVVLLTVLIVRLMKRPATT